MSEVGNVVVSIEHFVAQEIEKIGDWIAPQFDAAAKLYSEMSDAEKQAAQYAYGVIAVINSNLSNVDAILPLIQEKFPSLSIDVLHGFLETLLNDINVVTADVPVTLPDAITAVAKYLEGLQGNGWAQISQAVGNVLLTLLSPETPIQKAVVIAEYVYTGIIKPLLAIAA